MHLIKNDNGDNLSRAERDARFFNEFVIRATRQSIEHMLSENPQFPAGLLPGVSDALADCYCNGFMDHMRLNDKRLKNLQKPSKTELRRFKDIIKETYEDIIEKYK